MTDPIADMLTRIRNGFMAKKPEVIVPYSRFKNALAEILVREGYLASIEKVEVSELPWSPRTSRRAARKGRSDLLRLVLCYDDNGRPSAKSLERISKPSRRVYVSKDEVPVVLSGVGVAILSTSNGLLTNRQAKHFGVGGELVCEIY